MALPIKNSLGNRLFLALGSNLNPKADNMCTAIKHLQERGFHIASIAPFIETEPWGFESENTFLNSVLVAYTQWKPQEILMQIKEIEQAMGRVLRTDTSQPYTDRPIDIDILLYSDWVQNTPTLTIPHPRLTERIFVLQPLAQIAPKLRLPSGEKTILELLKQLPNHG